MSKVKCQCSCHFREGVVHADPCCDYGWSDTKNPSHWAYGFIHEDDVGPQVVKQVKDMEDGGVFTARRMTEEELSAHQRNYGLQHPEQFGLVVPEDQLTKVEDYKRLREATGIGLMDAKYMLQTKTYKEALEYIASGQWDRDYPRPGFRI